MSTKKPKAKASKKKVIVEDSDSSIESNIKLDMNDSEQELPVNIAYKKSKIFNSELYKLLDTLNKYKQEYTDAVQKVEDYNYDKFNELTHKYEQKELEYAQKQDLLKKNHDEMVMKLTKEFNEKKYNIEKDFDQRKYELEKNYEKEEYDFDREFRKKMDEAERKKNSDEYAFCLGILKKKGETTIKISDLDEKNEKLENMSQKHEEEMEELEEKLTEKHEKELQYQLEKIELTNKSTLAELTAQNEQKIKQIEVLQETIKSLKTEINEQRALTKHVAEAGKQGQIVQNMGNK